MATFIECWLKVPGVGCSSPGPALFSFCFEDIYITQLNVITDYIFSFFLIIFTLQYMPHIHKNECTYLFCGLLDPESHTFIYTKEKFITFVLFAKSQEILAFSLCDVPVQTTDRLSRTWSKIRFLLGRSVCGDIHRVLAQSASGRVFESRSSLVKVYKMAISVYNVRLYLK